MFMEPRTTEGRNERLPSAAGELVAQAPDLILVQSVPATRALMQATKSIPIVMVGVGNPIDSESSRASESRVATSPAQASSPTN